MEGGVKLPEQFLNSLREVEGFDEAAFREVHASGQRITSIRLNPFKPAETDFPLGAKVPWCSNGFYLDERPSFTFDPLFQAGGYYVQEAGSMFIHHALKHSADLSQDLAVLDLCAAPGGKSTLINELISDGSFLISNEVIQQRAGVLSFNLSKWGTCNAAVTSSDPSAFARLGGVFDVMVADVPCSGSGLFRKQPEAVSEWSPEAVNLCCTRQKRILGDALACLKRNGILIYSTCSYSREENEDIVSWLIEEFGMSLAPLPLVDDWGIVDTGLGYRFFPNLTQSEGFFCAVLKKDQETTYEEARGKKSKADPAGKTELATIRSFLKPSDPNSIIKFQDGYKLVSPALLEFRERQGSQLYFKKLGTSIGEFKQTDLLPDHELALSIHLGDNVHSAELSKSEAISFLKKESVNVKASRGICLMRYKQYGIGWAKVLDTRINNYLPKNFRILGSEED